MLGFKIFKFSSKNLKFSNFPLNFDSNSKFWIFFDSLGICHLEPLPKDSLTIFMAIHDKFETQNSNLPLHFKFASSFQLWNVSWIIFTTLDIIHTPSSTINRMALFTHSSHLNSHLESLLLSLSQDKKKKSSRLEE